jgi:quercetin 2,3-dioxygenase
MDEVVRIYKAYQRTVTNKDYAQLHSLNNGESRKDDNKSFLDLHFIDDIFLAPNKTISLSQYNDYQLLVLPIIGGVEIAQLPTENNFIGAEQFFWKQKHSELTVTNPYEENDINFLCLAFISNKIDNLKEHIEAINFAQKNSLITLINLPSLKISVGIYDGRREDNYYTIKNSKGIFCFVIRGVFEVKGRLLHPRDGLSFINVAEIDMEALSDGAIILVVELG